MNNKYKAVKVGKFASKKEARRAGQLQILEKVGQISNLELQVKYELLPKQMADGKVAERALHYIADFRYTEGGRLIVEDVKGMKTPAYVIKRKLMLFVHNIRVLET